MIKFTEWLKIKEEIQPSNLNNVKKKDDDKKIQMNVKNALVGAMKQKQDPAKALQNVAQQAKMDPNYSPDDILKIKDVADKVDQKNKEKLMNNKKI
jgi:LAS superfamily LD-carboxypeptidase LdcB